MKIIRCDTN